MSPTAIAVIMGAALSLSSVLLYLHDSAGGPSGNLERAYRIARIISAVTGVGTFVIGILLLEPRIQVTALALGEIVPHELVCKKVYDRRFAAGTLRDKVSFTEAGDPCAQKEVIWGQPGQEAPLVSRAARTRLGKYLVRTLGAGPSPSSAKAVIEVPARTEREYTIVWRETRQCGSMDYEENDSLKRVRFSYRTGIKLESCDWEDVVYPSPSDRPQPSPEASPTALRKATSTARMPTPSVPAPAEPSPSSAHATIALIHPLGPAGQCKDIGFVWYPCESLNRADKEYFLLLVWPQGKSPCEYVQRQLTDQPYWTGCPGGEATYHWQVTVVRKLSEGYVEQISPASEIGTFTCTGECEREPTPKHTAAPTREASPKPTPRPRPEPPARQ